VRNKNVDDYGTNSTHREAEPLSDVIGLLHHQSCIDRGN